jgi:regulation of enolase protein 1 (concanavalin A-like superfamily)
MNAVKVIRYRAAAACLILLASVSVTAAAQESPPPLKQGDAVTLGGRRAVVTKLDTLPYVETEYTKRYKFDSHDNPKLKQLRERYRLEEVVAPGKDEFDRQVLLLDWVHHRFKKFGKPTSPARGALDILEACDAGHTFFCAHYADVLVSAAASLGWVCRPLALRRPDQIGEGSTEHSSTEIWSNQHRKWVMLDPTFAMYVEKDGAPLNAFELRHEWFYRGGRDLVFVIGKERTRHRKSDMPLLRGRFPGFGDLSLDPSAVNVYAFIGYVPNTNLMDAGHDWGGMFITQDKLCEGTKWHRRKVPAAPATDPYFPIGQAAMTLGAEGGVLNVRLKTLTPNFKSFLVRIDGGKWEPVTDYSFFWVPHAGTHRLEVKTLNQFGVEGPASVAEVEVAAGAGEVAPRASRTRPAEPALGAFEAQADVGKVDPPGSGSFDRATGEYRITSGGQNIWDARDDFHFVYRQVTGDVALTADVSLAGQGKNAHRKAGLMVRQSLNPDAAYADVMVHGDGLIALQYRSERGGMTKDIKSDVKAPARIRIERRGDDFVVSVAAKSKDGEKPDKAESFQPVGSIKVSLNGPVYVGLAVCSHDVKETETAVFTGVVVRDGK